MIARVVEVVDDTCPSCDGAGRVANDDTDSLMTPMWADCVTCDGSGRVPEPDLFEESRPVDIDECGRCEGTGMYVVVVDGEAGYACCSWCAGTGMRGAA